jgi:hypothetical protein
MPGRRLVRLLLSVGLLIVFSFGLDVKPAGAAPRRAPAPAPAAGSAWTWIAQTWLEASCKAFPKLCGSEGFRTKEGCGIDPNGGCKAIDEGCGIDPDGKCRPPVSVFSDEGCGIDPSGLCGH